MLNLWFRLSAVILHITYLGYLDEKLYVYEYMLLCKERERPVEPAIL